MEECINPSLRPLCPPGCHRQFHSNRVPRRGMVGGWELPQGAVPAASYSVAGGAHAGGESNRPGFLLGSAQGVGGGGGKAILSPVGQLR